jgi:hypothetical protein
MAIKHLSDGNPDGTTLGQSASDLVGFHGATPVDQAATIASVTMPGLSIGGYGYTGTANLTTLWAAVNSITAALREKGIIAAS